MSCKRHNSLFIFSLFTCGALFVLSSCASEPAGIAEEGHEHHEHHSPNGAVTVEPDDTMLDAIHAQNSEQKLPYFGAEDFTPVWLSDDAPELQAFHRVPEFELVNQNGTTVSSQSYDDTIYVATFFFATCPGICSTMNERLLAVQAAVEGLDDVRILSHSITPEIDTVDVLNEYAMERGINSATWDLVTGDRDRVYAVAKAGYFASEDMGEQEARGDFKHTESILLVDRNRMIRGIYNGLSRNAIRHVIADIERLREEQPLN